MATLSHKINNKQLEASIERAVQRAFQAEMINFRALAIPYVSKREQADIIRSLKSMTKADREIVKTVKFRI